MRGYANSFEAKRPKERSNKWRIIGFFSAISDNWRYMVIPPNSRNILYVTSYPLERVRDIMKGELRADNSKKIRLAKLYAS